jgi:hypothetical protein
MLVVDAARGQLMPPGRRCCARREHRVDEALHVEAQLAKGRGATGAGKPGADHDHGELAAVQRRDQPIRRLAPRPSGGGIAVRHSPIDA